MTPTARKPLLALLLLPLSVQAVTLDCGKIRDDGVSFNFKELGGPKTVHHREQRVSPPTTMNTTFTVDICGALLDSDAEKEERCPSGTRVCGKTFSYRVGKEPYLEDVIPIAGEYSTSRGSNRALDPKFTRLKDSAANSDGKEGVLVELHGGKFPDETSGTPQKAVIQFLCDKDVTGNEGFEDQTSLDISRYGSMARRAEDDKDEADDPELPELDKGQSLTFVSYQLEGDTKVLRLNWKTKYACEDAAESGGDSNKTGGWGFFTWFIIIVFLLAAAYIIFGSWLNYNRYGARGWDLIPHGDTIRDIPYIIKDWTAGFGDKLKGQGSSRGGYSAV